MSQTQVIASTVEQVLVELGEAGSSGCLTVTDPAGEQAEVYFKDGSIYSVFVPGRRAQLGARLIASGDLSPEALASALDVQTNELQGWRLGELLVHLGYVERPVVEAFVIEQLRDAMAALLEWPVAAHKFRKTKKTRQDVAPPMTVRDLLAEVEMRRHRWVELTNSIGGERGIPMLSARPDGAADVVLSSADWALLCKVDGTRDIAGLAAECGFTVFEAAHVVRALMDAGLVDVELPDDEPVASVTSLEDARGKRPAFEPAPDPEGDELAGAVKKVTAALGDLFRPVSAPGAGMSLAEAADLLEEAEASGNSIELPDDPEIDVAALEAEREAREDEERLASEVEAWLEHEEWLVELAKGVEVDAWAAHVEWLEEQRGSAEPEAWLAHYQWLEDERRRCEVDAWAEHETWVTEHTAKLNAKHEAERKAMEHKAWKDHKAWLAAERKRVEPEAWGVHQEWMDGERVRVEDEAWAEHETWLDESERKEVQRLEAERKASETKAWKEHKAWLTAERKRVEPEAWEQHVERLDAERAHVEDEAWDAHNGWLEDERAAFESAAWEEHTALLESERVAAEEEAWKVHGKYLEWHRTKVETEAWVAHTAWLDSERARVEKEAWALHATVLADEERQRAEGERQRVAAEAARVAAARAEQERLEDEARQEQERRRRRQEQADRAVEAAREEAERKVAEEAARVEAERLEAERLEAERLAAEEAERLEAERIEAERLEAERLAAEEAERREAERMEAERLEAQRVQAEQLAAQEAARVEAERLAAEAAERAAAEEAARVEAERVAAEEAEARKVALAEEMAAAAKTTNAAAFADLNHNPLEAEEVAEESGVVEDYGPEPSPSPGPAVDTAALLRELASLGGFGDDSADSSVTSAPVKTAPVSKDSDKRRRNRLFGR